jgi:hypothetical protein
MPFLKKGKIPLLKRQLEYATRFFATKKKDKKIFFLSLVGNSVTKAMPN